MNDTPEYIHKKQLEIILSKSTQERILMGLKMMEDARLIVLNSIKKDHPGISEKDMKIEFIKRYYKNELSEEYLNDVIRWIKER
ncbi:MAG TPA: hypothetical protein VFW11_06680 [Cyclobacteriaceae bacterium]|nr:hypothetical protein [Cyclobacteriaceae bacterium]